MKSIKTLNPSKPVRLQSIHRNRITICLLTGLLAAIQGSIALGAVRWGEAVLRQQSHWYDAAEARAVADSVIQYQSPQGGWPKSTNLATPPRTPDDIPPRVEVGQTRLAKSGAGTLRIDWKLESLYGRMTRPRQKGLWGFCELAWDSKAMTYITNALLFPERSPKCEQTGHDDAHGPSHSAANIPCKLISSTSTRHGIDEYLSPQ
ncbi:MAG: hypothetical protein JSW47_05545 [Phycisphaerales bacterium]|nr:MAG: hypothetical protein JSW47_05545 [Phycisphaerales bacterium]